MKFAVITFLLTSLFSNISAFSQQVESLHSFQLGYPGIGYSYEHALGKQLSINMEAGVDWSWTYGANTSDIAPIDNFPDINQPKEYTKNNFEINFSPVLRIEPRFYYSVKRRFEVDRFTNNSASFFCITTSFHSTIFQKNERSYLELIPKWGFRRAMGKHFIFETQIGAGLNFYRNSHLFAAGLDIKFGYVF